MRLAVLVSGTGSILEAISHSGIEISLVVADRECEAIQRALDRGLNVELIERLDFGEKFDRVAFTNQLVRKLEIFLKINLMEDVEESSTSYKIGSNKNLTMGDLINQAIEE